MKKLALLLLALAVCLAIFINKPQQVVQAKPIPTASIPVIHKIETRINRNKPRKVNAVTESALNEIGFSLNNPVRVIADVVDFQPPAHYECLLSCSMKGTATRIVMVFQLERDSSITSLKVNDKIIPTPDPIDGLPLDKSASMEDVDIVAWPIGMGNEYVGIGYCHKDILPKNGRLVIILKREGVFASAPKI